MRWAPPARLCLQPVTDAATLARIMPAARGKVVELDARALGIHHLQRYKDVFAAQHERWKSALERGVWLKGYWRVAWQNEAIRVKAIDSEAKTVTFAKPIAGGIGSKYHRPEGNGEEKYWLFNLLEEIDQPGEWSLDFVNGKLYFYPPSQRENARVMLADNEEPVIRIVDATNVVIRQIGVDTNLRHGIEIKGGLSNCVAGCTVRNVSRYGVKVEGGFYHAVQSCDLYDLGAGGVWLGGGDENSNPRVPAGHRVVNNHIRDFARIEKVYAPGINCGYTGGGGGGHHPAVGMVVAHNLIHDTPHAGMLFGSWDSIFEYNEVSAFCQVSNDMGGWYSYDQYALDGNHTFRYNYIHGSADGDGVYFDNDHRDMHIYGFVFVSALPSKIENNVAIMCKTPYTWQWVKDGKTVKGDERIGSGKNIVYDGDPGFVDLAKSDFRLKPDSQVFKDLPGFQPIPFDKMGLYVDEYRQRLPTDLEAGRIRKQPPMEQLGTEILDR